VDDLIFFLLCKAVGRLGTLSIRPLVSPLVIEGTPPALESSFVDIDDFRAI